MTDVRWSIGLDISTQTVSAMLMGCRLENGLPTELIISSAWTASRPCREEKERKSPDVWVRLVRECIIELKKQARETALVAGIGVSTTFPGVFPILCDGRIDPAVASLYDNTDDAGINELEFADALAAAETDTANRMWTGNMVIGLAGLVKSGALRLNDARAIAPPNTAFAYALAQEVGFNPDANISDFTETAISGLYDISAFAPMAAGVTNLLARAVPEADWTRLAHLLPQAVPAWRNVIPSDALQGVRHFLELPELESISIGAGDSPLAVLALMSGLDTIVNVRGSSDSPVVIVEQPLPRSTSRETVFHYPLPTMRQTSDSPWCATAPMLRSGRVWDWVKSLRFESSSLKADEELERLAIEALKRRTEAPPGSLERKPIVFDTALGGERAPRWDPHAAGSITGLIESHGIGDIALAALEGMSGTLKECIELLELRYGISPSKLLLAGGPAKNALWNWITGEITGKKTYATTFSDASLLGAALLGMAASLDGRLDDDSIALHLTQLSDLASIHPLIRPVAVTAPKSLYH